MISFAVGAHMSLGTVGSPTPSRNMEVITNFSVIVEHVGPAMDINISGAGLLLIGMDFGSIGSFRRSVGVEDAKSRSVGRAAAISTG